MRTRIVALAMGVLFAAPSVASGATTTVTDDAGADAPLGSPLTIRNMAPIVRLGFAPTEVRYKVDVTGPNAASAGSSPCQSVGAYREIPISYQGNGRYTVAVSVSTNPSDFTCSDVSTSTNQFTIAASATVEITEDRLLTRKPDEVGLIEHQLTVNPSPGSDRTEICYARNVSPKKDGSLPGKKQCGGVNSTARTQPFALERPGRWVFIARPVSASGVIGPWSEPVFTDVKAPFDLAGAPAFVDDKGPTYKLKGDVRAALPRKSKIVIYAANGRKGGKFDKITTVKTKRNGTFKVTFTREKPGRFRVRYRYAGSQLVAAGRVTQLINITRVFA